MNWHLEILPAEQRSLWHSRIQFGFPRWVLYGGTALALRLGHRESVDFDFFSSRPFLPLALKEEQSLDGEVLQAAPNTLTLLHKGVKLSFFGGLGLKAVSPPDLLGNCPLASLSDLAACKLAALVNRVELKDYLDVSALLRNGMPLSHMLGCANAVYRGEFPVTTCLKSLAWFDAPELEGLSKSDRQLLEQAALAVDEIPNIAVLPDPIGESINPNSGNR
jgi:hypothetical protein